MDCVVAARPIDDHLALGAIISGTWPGEVRLALGQVGAGEIGDGQSIGAAHRIGVDLLDVAPIH